MKCVLIPTGGRITADLVGGAAVVICTAASDTPGDVARSACEAVTAGAPAVAVCRFLETPTSCELVWANGAPTRRVIERDPGSDELPI
jgi:hypothetical protein